MKFPVRTLALGSVLLISLIAARATPTLIGEFALNGDLSNNVPGGPSLVTLPFAGVSGSITADGYVFATNQGLTFTSPAFTPTDFSIELSFKFTSISGWTKIVDFHDLGTGRDDGFYQLNGNLDFYNVVNSGVADFVAGTNVDVVLTRDGATGNVVGYVNGQQRITFTDSSALAVTTSSGNRLIFFVDDFATGQNEASGGTLNYLRVYDGALSGAEVAALHAAGAPSPIPEPGANAALLGLAAFGFFARRRRAGG